ncbi:MAG: DNA-binding protein [Oscillospiraceae bacterium]|nr:DNA-binding protein [Oscillospiraceae bacterium]
MKSFTNGAFGKVHVLRLDRGDYLLESIEAFIREQNITNAVVLSGIGTFDCCSLYMVLTTDFPVKKHFAKWENQPLELVSVDGVVASGIPHLHAVVSDCKGAYAGHLEYGCRISYLGEVVIAEIDGFNFERRLNEQGTNLLEDKV